VVDVVVVVVVLLLLLVLPPLLLPLLLLPLLLQLAFRGTSQCVYGSHCSTGVPASTKKFHTSSKYLRKRLKL
jgi:hypothetical protein